MKPSSRGSLLQNMALRTPPDGGDESESPVASRPRLVCSLDMADEAEKEAFYQASEWCPNRMTECK